MFATHQSLRIDITKWPILFRNSQREGWGETYEAIATISYSILAGTCYAFWEHSKLKKEKQEERKIVKACLRKKERKELQQKNGMVGGVNGGTNE